MDLGALRGRVLAANLMAFGVPVTITRPFPDQGPVTGRAIWMTPAHDASVPIGHDYPKRDASRVLAVPRSLCDTLPRNTFIDAPEATTTGAPVRRWQVDRVDRADSDHLRVAVTAVKVP